MKSIILDERARALAYDWHGGQSSPLYAFASSGLVADLDALLSEVQTCIYMVERCAGYTEKHRTELVKLRRYCQHGLKHIEGADYSWRAPWARVEAAA